MPNKTILGIAALAGLIATQAWAADMAIKAAPPRAPVPLATTWTGCYVNAGLGYGFFRQEQHEFDTTSGLALVDATNGGSGYLGTIGGGCDYQFRPGSGWGNWVVGAFADYDFMDLRGHLHATNLDIIGSEKESSAVAAGGRIGYLVTPQILAYVNGGWSSTRFDGVTFFGSVNGAATGITLPAHTFTGGFIGGGTEVAVAAIPGLYWRNEYRFASYRSADLAFSGPGLTGDFNHESKNVQTITTSLVWKFQTPALAGSSASMSPMAVKAARAPVPVATTWTGCYVNGGGGYGFFRQEQQESFATFAFTNETTAGSGWLGTIGGGCDYQFSPGNGWGNWVVGVLADYDFMDLRGHLDIGTGDGVGPEKESSAVAAGGRIGYLVTPQILTYVNGGWSSTRFEGVNFVSPVSGQTNGLSIPAHTFNGGFIGGGTEVAVAAFPGLYWRNEYRYAVFSSADLQVSLNGLPLTNDFNHESKNVQTITTSLIWKFH